MDDGRQVLDGTGSRSLKSARRRFRSVGRLLLTWGNNNNNRMETDLLFWQMTVHSWHTSKLSYRPLWIISLPAMPLAWPSAWRKQVIHQKPPHGIYNHPQISIDGTTLKPVDHFTYLGSVISNDASIDKDVDNRLAIKASGSFGRLKNRVWKNHSLRLSTKILVYKAVVITTLLYGSEAWVLYRRQVKLLERFHQRCFLSILQIKWQDRKTNTEVLEQANIPSIESMLLSRRWAGHLARMDDSRMPKAVFYGELRDGKRKRGAPKKRFKDQLKQQLNLTSIKEQHWDSIAKDRNRWRATTKQGVMHFEAARRADLDEKRKRRKALVTSCPPDGGFPCSTCTKICRSRIGLFSHQKFCRQRLTFHWSSDTRNQPTTTTFIEHEYWIIH